MVRALPQPDPRQDRAADLASKEDAPISSGSVRRLSGGPRPDFEKTDSATSAARPPRLINQELRSKFKSLKTKDFFAAEISCIMAA